MSERKFLGDPLLTDGRPTIAPASLQRVQDRIRKITCRDGGVSFERMIRDLNGFTTDCAKYFRLSAGKSHFQSRGSWIRRKLRCERLTVWKRAKWIAAFLQLLDVSWNQSWTTNTFDKGWWRMSGRFRRTTA